jgi:hypothetical protein
MRNIDEKVMYYKMYLIPILLAGIIKKRGWYFKSRVNPVPWITNPNSHPPISNSIAYFIRGCLAILFKLYNRSPQDLLAKNTEGERG